MKIKLINQNPPTPPLKKGGKGGFTFVEYVLVVALAGMIFLVLAQSVTRTIELWDIALAGSRFNAETEVSFSRMVRDIRQIRNKTSLVTASSTTIRFTDIDNNDIQYDLHYDSSRGRYQIRRNNMEIIDGVLPLKFEYLDKNGAVIETPLVSPNATNVRMVRIIMKIIPAENPLTAGMTTAAKQEKTKRGLTVRTLVRLRDVM